MEIARGLDVAKQQSAFVQHGSRSIDNQVDLGSVPNSPWSKNTPDAVVDSTGRISTPTDRAVIEEFIR